MRDLLTRINFCRKRFDFLADKITRNSETRLCFTRRRCGRVGYRPMQSPNLPWQDRANFLGTKCHYEVEAGRIDGVD